MRVVIDTNVMVSGIFWKGTPHQILEAWNGGRFTVCASAPILEEYFEVIERLTAKIGREHLAARWKTFIFDHCELVDPVHSFKECRDPDDLMFVECALSAGADFIVSGDSDLLDIEHLPGARVLTPAQFARLLKQASFT